MNRRRWLPVGLVAAIRSRISRIVVRSIWRRLWRARWVEQTLQQIRIGPGIKRQKCLLNDYIE